MNQNNKLKLIIALILFGLSVLLFSLGIQKYQVLTNSRAEGISPTVTVSPAPSITATPLASQRAGFTDIPNVDDHTYTPPLPLDQVTAEMKAAAAQKGGYCNIDNKECKGWAWRFVCNVSPDIVWEAAGQPNWTSTDAHRLYTRWCTRDTGSTQDIKVKFERLDVPEDENQVYKLDDVGCGKLVQIDITSKNCEPGIDYDEDERCDGQESNIKDALVYYTGVCPAPTATLTPTLTLTPSLTPTGTLTPSPSPTLTVAPTATLTPTITLTPTLTLTPTITLTPSVTLTPTNSPTPTITPSPTPTNTPAPTATQAPEPTYAPQPTYTPQPTYVAQVLPTATPPTKLVVNNQPPGMTPWMLVLLPIGLILVGLLF